MNEEDARKYIDIIEKNYKPYTSKDWRNFLGKNFVSIFSGDARHIISYDNENVYYIHYLHFVVMALSYHELLYEHVTENGEIPGNPIRTTKIFPNE